MFRRGNRLCPSGSILLSTHYNPLSGRPAARRVLERFFPECSAAPERGFEMTVCPDVVEQSWVKFI